MIDTFHGDYRWLSNFYPVEVFYEGVKYQSVEHAYQAAKTPNHDIRQTINKQPTAGKAKNKAYEMIDIKAIQPHWDSVKLDIMRILLVQKFDHNNPKLRQLLLDTGDQELIEGNWWNDTYWGVCKGKGENNLGKLLMEIRANIE